jgi:putrescine---pyruvate transaminase
VAIPSTVLIDRFQAPRRTSDWQAADRQYHLHPFTDHPAMHATGARIFTRGDGVHLFDSQGNRYLDAMSGLWCVNLGYNRQEIIDAATRQMSELAYASSFFEATHPAAIRLATHLSTLLPMPDTRVLFTNSGSEANDTIVRMVRRYWEVVGQPQRTVMISRRNAYHGSTLAAASLGGFASMHAQGGLPLPDFLHIREPHWSRYAREMDAEEFGIEAARDLEACILRVGPERIAAFFGEPVQGAGGVIVPPRSYWPEIQRITERYGILLVADEVICGFGRTGQWFGSETFGFTPDLMAMAKGLSGGYQPIGAVMVGTRVGEQVFDTGEFEHGFTCAGHPVACAVADTVLTIMEREGVVRKVTERLAPHFRSEWLTLADHPLVDDARICGLMAAIDLRAGRASSDSRKAGALATACRESCLRRGVIVRVESDTLIVAPPLVSSAAQLSDIVAVIHAALDEVLRSLARSDR